MIRRLFILVALVCALGTAAAVVSVPAVASPSPSQVIADCNAHDQLTSHYSATLLRSALSTMTADVKEYTDCYDVIQSALLAQIRSSHQNGDGSASGSGGSFLSTPLIVVLVLLALAAAGLGGVALRRRSEP